MADVVAILFVADVVAIIVSCCGRFCYHHSLLVDIIANVYVLLDCVADVVATVAVSIAILKDGVSYCGRCYYHIVVGQCYCHSYVLLDCVADVIATVAVGIAIL